MIIDVVTSKEDDNNQGGVFSLPAPDLPPMPSPKFKHQIW